LEKDGVKIPVKGIGAYVIPIAQSTRPTSFEILRTLRESGISADIDLMGRKISKALAYANSIRAEKVILVGEKELVNDSVTIRDMESGDQQTININDIVEHLKN
jgi:histidyl-tRNA synthetase